MSILQRSSLGCGNLQPIMLIVLWMTTVSSTPSFQCPEMAVLNSSLDLTCCVESSFNTHYYTTPAGDSAVACNLTGRFCIPHSNFNASVINQTCSVLTIHRIQQSHEGEWKCGADANDPDQEARCNVSVSGTSFNTTTPPTQPTGPPTTDVHDREISQCGVTNCIIPIVVVVVVVFAIIVTPLIIFIKGRRQERTHRNNENEDGSEAVELNTTENT